MFFICSQLICTKEKSPTRYKSMWVIILGWKEQNLSFLVQSLFGLQLSVLTDVVLVIDDRVEGHILVL